MPVLVVWILGALAPLLISTAGRVLFLLGFAAVTFTGFSALLNSLKTQVTSAWAGMGSLVQVLGILRIDQAVLIVFAAYAAKLAISAIDGAISKLVTVGPRAA